MHKMRGFFDRCPNNCSTLHVKGFLSPNKSFSYTFILTMYQNLENEISVSKLKNHEIPQGFLGQHKIKACM